jgi:hypothetical protein
MMRTQAPRAPSSISWRSIQKTLTQRRGSWGLAFDTGSRLAQKSSLASVG